MKLPVDSEPGKAKPGSLHPAGSAARAVLHVGAWPAENVWERAERARVWLAICGFITFGHAERIRDKIAADFKAQQNVPDQRPGAKT